MPQPGTLQKGNTLEVPPFAPSHAYTKVYNRMDPFPSFQEEGGRSVPPLRGCGSPGSTKDTKGIHEERRREEKRFPRRGSTKGAKGAEKKRDGGKKISTKGHEERRRGTKGLEEIREGFAKGRKGVRQGREGKEKRFPRRGTKNDEGALRGWRRLERGLPRIGKGGNKSTKDTKG